MHREVERFLIWRHSEFPEQDGEHLPAAWCYLLRGQREGVPEAALGTAWGALELFLSYVERSGRR